MTSPLKKACLFRSASESTTTSAPGTEAHSVASSMTAAAAVELRLAVVVGREEAAVLTPGGRMALPAVGGGEEDELQFSRSHRANSAFACAWNHANTCSESDGTSRSSIVAIASELRERDRGHVN